jgi:Domain of unknown function (DUF5666)
VKRLMFTVVSGIAGVAVVACGSAAAGGARSSPSPSGRGFARNGAAGTLQQINAATLILSDSSGADITVAYTSSTTFTKTNTGSVADITAGTCVVATGRKDTNGALSATAVRVSEAVGGACPLGRVGGNGGIGGPPPGASPNPNFSPPPNAANFAGAAGMVTDVNGTAVTLRENNGTSVTVTVPSTVRVTKTSPVQVSALQVGQCIAAVGAKDSSGTVAARTITITPPGANGTCFSGRGGGGLGGGGIGGGGTGGGPPQGGGIVGPA